jgi:hypothetical protein
MATRQGDEGPDQHNNFAEAREIGRRVLCADGIAQLGQDGLEDLLLSAAKRNRAMMPSDRSSGIAKPSAE